MYIDWYFPSHKKTAVALAASIRVQASVLMAAAFVKAPKMKSAGQLVAMKIALGT